MAFYTLNNGCASRTLEVSGNGVRTTSIQNLMTGTEFILTPVREFAFSVNDVGFSSWSASQVREVDGNVTQATTAPVLLGERRTNGGIELDFALGGLTVTLVYELHPGIAGMRKYLRFSNPGQDEVRLSNLIFDDTCIAPGHWSDCDFYAGNDDVPQSLCFTLEGSEDIIRCHNPKRREGWLMGSTAPGVLRYFMVYPNWGNAINGCNMSSAPFAKFLKPGETFTTPASLLALYSGERTDPETVAGFRRLIRRGLPELRTPGRVMYCTWLPFLKNINHDLTMELAERAADFGFGYFVLDDGWFENGNRAVDRQKFPQGLEPLAHRVRELGMKFGLWLNVGTDYGMTGIPENWYARRPDGQINRLGFDYSNAQNVLCLGSAYRHEVLKTLQTLAERYEVGYFKLDFSSVLSPYGILPWGCHATGHDGHRGWEDSFLSMYEGMREIRDAMLEKHPEVIVDFSFEAFGTERPNLAALELSPLHHVSNTSGNVPEIQSIERVRRNFYRWLGKLPAERILNGLLSLQNVRAAEYLLTALAGAPLVAGDLRKLDATESRRLKKFTAAFNELNNQAPLTEFSVLAAGEEFDGFLRRNAAGHGFAALFNRQDTMRAAVLPTDFPVFNVETGKCGSGEVSAHDCAMFVF